LSLILSSKASGTQRNEACQERKSDQRKKAVERHESFGKSEERLAKVFTEARH
jgi:hypothetical protein